MSNDNALNADLDKITILFVNNDGGGFAEKIEVAAGTTVGNLFDQKLEGKNAANFLIRVNRQNVSRGQLLADRDRVSFTPTKVQGA